MENKKRALITGSSRGIGRAIALALAAEGIHILLHYSQNKQKALETCNAIISAGGSAELLQADLSCLEQTKHLSQEAKNVDILILNASIQHKTPWTDITLDACQEQLNCNFVSSLLLIQSVIPHMKAQRWGRIITIGSVQEKRPHPDMLVYSASKAAQTNMAESLAVQLAPFGITVNNVAPGVIDTDRNIEALSDPEYAKIVTSTIPAGFYGTPEDCAGTVLHLCSEASRYITGQSIYIDGGKGIG